MQTFKLADFKRHFIETCQFMRYICFRNPLKVIDMEPVKTRLANYNFETIVDLIIRLAVLYLLISWCINILKPFVTILIWGTVITLAIYPLYTYLVKLFRGRKIIASVIITLCMLSILVIPSWLIGESLFNGLDRIRELYSEGQPLIPPPGEATKNWPAFAQPIIDIWQLASKNIGAATMQYKDQLEIVGTFILRSLASIGQGVLQFVASIVLAGVFLIYSEPLSNSMLKIFKKLAGKDGENMASLSVVTVRNVFKGVLGVAFIQAALAGLGYFIAGVPYAGLWTLISLILAIVQIGVGPVAIPIAIYMFTVTDTLTATLLAIWMIPVTLSDNILRPILMGMGAPVPMLVIFMGAIGGFIFTGFIGLFLGAIILSIGYKLFLVWIETETES
jgi:predicted PurR-regulated permease PerM